MGDENFYAYDGQVKTLPCTVRRFIFDDLNYDVKDKVFAGINSEFKEIIWLYPGTDSSECNKYVVHSPEENYWHMEQEYLQPLQIEQYLVIQ